VSFISSLSPDVPRIALFISGSCLQQVGVDRQKVKSMIMQALRKGSAEQRNCVNMLVEKVGEVFISMLVCVSYVLDWLAS